MEKDKVFFSADNNGLTSTSANHIANLAKEFIQERQIFLDGFKFYNTEVSLIGSDKSDVISVGRNTDELAKVPAILEEIAEATSLIAWLREAIKAKESLLDEVRNISLADFCNLKGLTIPTKPKEECAMTEDDYWAQANIKERNRYYMLETRASVLGKYIHQSGAYSEARKDATNKDNNPTKVMGTGRDTVIYRYTRTIPSQEVEDMFFHLQKEYRTIQAELNSMKYDMERTVREDQIRVHEEYMVKSREYIDAMQELNNQLQKYILTETKRIGKLKILIPDKLKEIYQKINSLE